MTTDGFYLNIPAVHLTIGTKGGLKYAFVAINSWDIRLELRVPSSSVRRLKRLLPPIPEQWA
jgi:hypothetical protein